MLLPRLPDPVAPAQHEIAASYIGRLARLHGLDVNALWRCVTEREASGGMRRLVVPERLAAITGRTVHALAGALPELRTPQPDWAMFRHQPQPGCHHCDAKHLGGEVIRILPHHRYVCTRHRLWLCPSDADGHTTPLDTLPEIVQAQHRHLRVLRRHGWAITYDAVLTAILICAQLWSLPTYGDLPPSFSWCRSPAAHTAGSLITKEVANPATKTKSSKVRSGTEQASTNTRGKATGRKRQTVPPPINRFRNALQRHIPICAHRVVLKAVPRSPKT